MKTNAFMCLGMAVTLVMFATGCNQGTPEKQVVPNTPKTLRSEQSFRSVVQDAIASKAKTLRIPPGRYRIGPDASGKAHLLLQDVHGLSIDATGVELVMTDGLKTALVAVYNSSNITIKGLTVDCDPVTFLQGKIAAIAPDRAWYDLQVDPGYPLDPVAGNIPLRPMSILDKNTPELSWKHGVPDLFPAKVEWVAGEPGVLRVYMVPRCRGQAPVEIGDLAVLPAFGAPGFTCRGSVDVTFEGCTLYQAGSMAFHEHGGDGNTHMINCRVMRRPGTGRLLSSNADGFHSKNMRKGPTIEKCLFEGMHDDGINIHGMFGAVAGAVTASNKIKIVPYYEESGKPGDIIEFFSGKTGESLGCRTLRKTALVNNPNPERAKTYHNGDGAGMLFEYELDSPVTLSDADATMNLNLCGRDFTIRGNEFRAFRYRGILLRSIDGVVEDNRIFAIGNDGIELKSDLFSEGPYARNIRIRNNNIEKTGMIPFMDSGHGISVWTNSHDDKRDVRSLRLNRDIEIENNRITDVTRDGIYLRNTDGIVLRNNTISRVGERKVSGKIPPQPISVSDVDNLHSKPVVPENSIQDDTSAPGSPASQPASPQKILLHIDQGKVITKGFLGFGVELDPMALNAENRRHGVTDEDWKLLTERLAAMKMPIVRMMTQLSWFAKAGLDKFDYENPQAKSLLTHLDFCQRLGIDVILTDWAWARQCKWLKDRDDPAFAKGIATYLKYLLEEKKCTCIKYLVVGNEPNGEVKDVDVYSRMYHNVHEALKATGLRDKVRLMGPDTSGNWQPEWFDKAAAKIADVVDAYDFHRYAGQAEVRDDGQKLLLSNLIRFRPVVDKADPKGKDKPVLITEMGMEAAGPTYAPKMIGTFDYALHMGDYAIGVLNSGAKAGIAWCAFDVYYYDGGQLMTWGMWKYKDASWASKPWHAVWQEVTSSVPHGGDVLAVEGAAGPVHAAAVGLIYVAGEGARQPTYGKFVLLLANRSTDERAVSIDRSNGATGRWWKTCCTEGSVQRTAPADLVAGKAPLELTLPTESFTVLYLDFPVPTK